MTVKLLDCSCSLLVAREAHEREAAWAPRGTVDGDVDVHDLAHPGHELSELRVRGCKVEVPYENLARNGSAPVLLSGLSISISMLAKCGRSSGSQNDQATPDAPALAVRPIRCT